MYISLFYMLILTVSIDIQMISRSMRPAGELVERQHSHCQARQQHVDDRHRHPHVPQGLREDAYDETFIDIYTCTYIYVDKQLTNTI